MKRSLSLAAQFEKSETEYRITLNSLRQVADALGCDLVYALVPKRGTLHDLAESRATEEASADVLAVEHTMALENQAVGGVKEKIRGGSQPHSEAEVAIMPRLNVGDGNTPLTPEELDDLIPNLATREELNEWERENILQGTAMGVRTQELKSSDPVSDEYIRKLHDRMFDQTWKWAGYLSQD